MGIGMTDARWGWARLVLIFACGLAGAAGVRYGLIETPQLAWACSGAVHPWWCPVREGLILALRYQAMGALAAFAGFAALFAGQRRAAALAVGLGGAGLLLYAPELAAAGLLAGAFTRLRE
jgi:hypothetical protein